MKTTRFRANRIDIQNSRTISDRETEALTAKCQVESYRSHMVRGMIVDVRTYMHGIQIERIVVHREFPKDWWEAFKERWFPKFLLCRWPVRKEVIDIDRPIYGPVCPHLFDDDHRVHFEWMSAEAIADTTLPYRRKDYK